MVVKSNQIKTDSIGKESHASILLNFQCIKHLIRFIITPKVILGLFNFINITNSEVCSLILKHLNKTTHHLHLTFSHDSHSNFMPSVKVSTIYKVLL